MTAVDAALKLLTFPFILVGYMLSLACHGFRAGWSIGRNEVERWGC